MNTSTPVPAVCSKEFHQSPRLDRFALLIAVASCLLATRSLAAEIRGTVLNQNTQRFLERAPVEVKGTQFQTLTG